MTALEAVAVYLPEQRIPIEDLADRLGLSPMQVKVFKRYHGLATVCLDSDGTLLDLLLSAAAALGVLRDRRHQVRYVLHARSVPVAVPYP